MFLGYLMLGLVSFRLLWGVIGSPYARFRTFWFGPRAALAYLHQLLRGQAARHIGHNPAGSLAIYLLLLLSSVIGITGILTLGGEEQHGLAAAWLNVAQGLQMKTLHAAAAIGMLLLVRSMLTGHKLAGNPLWREECGNCHLAFHPSLLPARAWTQLLAGQAQHFGTDLALDEPTRQALQDFLTANSAERQQTEAAVKILQSLAPDAIPLRITDTPYWINKHREITPAQWVKPSVKSKANCATCHQDAEAGTFEDGAIRAS